MKKIISVILIAVLSLAIFTACGKKDITSGVKEVKYDDYVYRFVNAAKQSAKDENATQEEKEISKPKVTETKKENYNTTTITYEEDKTLDIFSNPETGGINGANLRVAVNNGTKEADLKKFFSLCETFIRQSDPSATDEQIKELVEKFKKYIPDDPTVKNYTGMCTYNAELNGLSYLVYYNFTEEPATCELLFS